MTNFTTSNDNIQYAFIEYNLTDANIADVN